MIDLLKVLNQTKAVAEEAGAFIRKERQFFDLKNVEQKGLNDLVSYVDKQAERMIVEKLSEVLPQADFITEEGSAHTDGKDYTWIIDPLDGTTNFIHGLPIFSVSIGLKHLDEMVMGVVYEVNFQECFYAMKGHGAFCNDKPIKVSQIKNLNESLIATGFPYSAFAQVDAYLDALKEIMKKTHGVRRWGSAAVDLCYVASGRFEGFFEFDLKPYDVAAGALIVQEAGGMVTDFSQGNNFLFGKQILASNGYIHKEFDGLLQEVWSE